MAGKLRVTLHKSIVSTTREARGTVRALGLHRIGETVELPDSKATRGQVRAVQYLVSVEEVSTGATHRRASGTHPASGQAAQRAAAPEHAAPESGADDGHGGESAAPEAGAAQQEETPS